MVVIGCKLPKQIVENPQVTIDPIVEETIMPHKKAKHQNKFEEKWVDSLLNTMSLDEKIGQLFMVQAYSNKEQANTDEINKLITNYHIGGLIFMQGTPSSQVNLYNDYQAKSKFPLLIGFDGEWGLSMRLKNSFSYPWNMTLGAVQDNQLIYQVGKQIAGHCKRVGVHLNFAPVVDINTNPNNPIIGNRSFGEDKENVTNKAIAFINGMQDHGVLANAKHFPGHGDTETDSHKTLPLLNWDYKRLDSIEMYPYKKIIDSDLASIMVAHLEVPSLKTEKGRPTSISKKVVTDLLQHKLGYEGLIFTDGLNMKGVANYTSADSVALEALKAGNDMLLIPLEVPKAVSMIKNAIDKNEISVNRLDTSVKKILAAKYRAGLGNYKPLVAENVESDVHGLEDDQLYKKIAEASVTLVKNEQNLLPLQRLDTLNVGLVTLGDANADTFLAQLRRYAKVDKLENINTDNYKTNLLPYNLICISYHKSDASPWKSYKMSTQEIELIKSISQYKKVILVDFASPYALLPIGKLENISSTIVAYQNNAVFQKVAAQQIFGALPIKGKLPVSISDSYKVNTGIQTNTLDRLSYGTPEEVGMNSAKLKEIDKVANDIIAQKMAPGMQVLVARKGKVVFEKAYGNYTYDANSTKVNEETIYDLASLTKIMGAFPLMAKAYDDQKYQLTSTLGELLPEYPNATTDAIKMIDLFTHQSGMQAWVPFYKETLDATGKPLSTLYSPKIVEGYSVKVAEGMYLRNTYADSLFYKIKNLPLRDKRDYKYSDLPLILFSKYLKNIYGDDMNELLSKFYTSSLGAYSLTYRPLDKFAVSKIAPTEQDNYFRYQEIQGTVHDMAAAMIGGISGNAGLFGNANDVAKMMQLYLNKGTYGGIRYFSDATFDTFNKVPFKENGNRRGLILDKPALPGQIKNTCGCTSAESFGHSGFTGTFTWADPKTELIYVFLSNRTYPNAEPNLLAKSNARLTIQQIIQDAMVK